ncbi:hypothetical protein M0R72_01080 [Candidatus Pacearchaeota archaeon]|jgi:hypothetical protein|nr:hypothetical protein [Candidatus Pacearchaeota archaeon]
MELTPSHIDAIIMHVRFAEGDLMGCFLVSSPPVANLGGAIGRLEAALLIARECYAEAKALSTEQISHRPSRLLNPCRASKEHVAGWLQGSSRDKETPAIMKSLDTIVKEYGIKYVFVESGRSSVEQKCIELAINPNDYPDAKFWCELSWGSGDGDKYDFAYNSIGDTLGEAIQNCLDDFQSAVRCQYPDQVNAAKDAGIYSKLIGEEPEESPDSDEIAAAEAADDLVALSNSVAKLGAYSPDET